MTRDLTKKQFADALERHGMTPMVGGYVDVGIEGESLNIYRFNAGDRYRDQLAYLLKERDRWQQRYDEEAATAQGGAA